MKEVQRMVREDIMKAYRLFKDDISKYIFENRLLYSFTGDFKFIGNVVCTTDSGKTVYEILNNTSEPIGVFGAGKAGKRFISRHQNIHFTCFIDNYKKNMDYDGLPIISLERFKEKYENGIVVIPPTIYHEEMLKQLKEEGFDEKRIINEGAETEKLKHLQYFDLPQLNEKRNAREIFVDGGGYDGTTSLDFLKWCSNWSQGYVYVCEPDEKNQLKCKENLSANKIAYKLISKGLWKDKERLRFNMSESCSFISTEGELETEVDSIDHLIKEPVTFIKMDIEGSEYQAILGAENMITRHKPKLAISVYHKPEDIWQLPLLIYQFNPGYQFYLRHYSFGNNETVLYAL